MGSGPAALNRVYNFKRVFPNHAGSGHPRQGIAERLSTTI